MASDAGALPSAITRELAALGRAVVQAERERERRVDARLAELDAWMDEANRVQTLITGGASRREARLRALEQAVESIAAERSRQLKPRPLDLPGRNRFDPSVVDMRSAEPTPDE
jgi:hypothetical protein